VCRVSDRDRSVMPPLAQGRKCGEIPEMGIAVARSEGRQGEGYGRRGRTREVCGVFEGCGEIC
jgi:hypothetical protein